MVMVMMMMMMMMMMMLLLLLLLLPVVFFLQPAVVVPVSGENPDFNHDENGGESFFLFAQTASVGIFESRKNQEKMIPVWWWLVSLEKASLGLII